MIFTGVKLTYKPTGGFSVPIDVLTLPLDSGISTSPFVVYNIEGLDPPDVTINPDNQARNPTNREIVLAIRFQPNYAIGQTSETLRNQLYPFLAPKLGFPVTFILMSGLSELASVACHIKRFEANPFSKDPEVRITLTCFDTYFTAAKYTLPSPGTITTQPMTITNQGSAPCGFIIKVTLSSSSSYIRLYDGVQSLWFNYSLLSGDVVTINTIVGSLSATVLRSGVTTNLMPGLSTGSTWFQFHSGINKLYVYGPTTWTLTSLEYYPRYWGV